MPAEGEEHGSFLQARCETVLVTNDWGLPLVLALLLLLLIYAFLYLPSQAHHNTTLWYLMEKDVEHNCGYKHLTSQTADTPSQNHLIGHLFFFWDTVVDWSDCGRIINTAWFWRHWVGRDIQKNLIHIKSVCFLSQKTFNTFNHYLL